MNVCESGFWTTVTHTLPISSEVEVLCCDTTAMAGHGQERG